MVYIISSKDDKHLQLINKLGLASSSSDALKKYQVKITKLANTLRKDILQDDVRELFSKSEIEAIEQAAAALGNFKILWHTRKSVSSWKRKESARFHIPTQRGQSFCSKVNTFCDFPESVFTFNQNHS